MDTTDDKTGDKSRSAIDGYPEAKVISPVFSEDCVVKNSSILISFSKSMDTRGFMDNITITDSFGNSLKAYFKDPVWFNENTFVEIPVDETNIIDLHGKKFMDIYVTVSKTLRDSSGMLISNSIDYKYRIKDETDNIPPSLAKVYAQLPEAYISAALPDGIILLEEGDFNTSSENRICSSNHINNKFDLYVEGNDFTNADVWAHCKFSRIYDTWGNHVYEQEKHKLIKLDGMNLEGNPFGKFCFDLSAPEYTDGMYKIIVTVSDSAGLDSTQSYCYHVIRDTSTAGNSNALINFKTPSFVNDSVRVSEIEKYCERIQFEYLSDDVYFVSRLSGLQKKYFQSKDDFKYYISWGISLEKLSDPVALNICNEESSMKKTFELPAAYKRFRQNHAEEDVYIQARIIDFAGNESVITTLVPGQIEFFNYEVLDDENGRKIRINYSNITGDNTRLSGIHDKTNRVVYRLFYGKLDGNGDNKDIVLKRNSVLNSEEDPYSVVSDKSEFDAEYNADYVVYIQPCYILTSKYNGQSNGRTFGPLYKVVVSAKDLVKKNNLAKPEFSFTKESTGINTGLFTIDVEIENAVRGVQYIPCYSTDGENWNFCKTNENSCSFTVENPLKAPLEKGGSWAWSSAWERKNFFEGRQFLGGYESVKAYIKILALKGNDVCYSDIQTIEFSEGDDNIPPEQIPCLTAHDSKLSFDGRSFKYDSLIQEADCHTWENFRYYFTEYNEAWGSNLSVLTEKEIEALPYAMGKLESTVWNNHGTTEYSLSPVIYTNGLKDGKYMFFAKVYDTFGNYSYITLGKAGIGTFKNKLNVKYNESDNKFITTLKREENEVFDRNMINIQHWGGWYDSSDGKWKNCQWYDTFGQQNELQDCIVSGNIIINETKKDYKYITGSTVSKEIDVSYPLKKGCFYRICIQGFNENSYNEGSGEGVNKVYGRPYGNSVETTSITDYVENETDYDLCTEETVSNTVYYYIPADSNELKDFRGSLFPSTGAVRSNKPVIINVISSMYDLGSDIDEWERRGKLIKTHYYTGSELIDFNDKDAGQDIKESCADGQLYYVIIAHFADNTSAISPVYETTAVCYGM